jgi:hypothetical protein
MAERFRTTISYANVMATLAVFVALGGTGYAMTQTDGTTIVLRSIPGDRLKRDTVTGREIRESKLGVVPKAKSAESATSADKANTAGTATTADSAKTADTAKTADSVKSAESAKTADSATRADSAERADSADSVNAGGPFAEAATQGNWGYAGINTSHPSYYKDALGFVHLRGGLSRSSGTDQIAIVLPGGFRPGAEKYFAVYTSSGTMGSITVYPNGNVLVAGAFSGSFTSLEGVTYRAGD